MSSYPNPFNGIFSLPAGLGISIIEIVNVLVEIIYSSSDFSWEKVDI